MIISRLVSGLGNQLFQYAVARDISLKKKVPLKLDTSFFQSQNLRTYRLDQYNIQAEKASEKEIGYFTNPYSTNATLVYKLYQKVEQFLPRTKRKIFTEKEWWVYEPSLYQVSSNVYLNGYWQHYKYFANMDVAIFNELTLKKELICGFESDFSEIEKDNSSVAVHIRRGDYLSDKHAYELMGVLPIEYYQSAITYINTKIGNPNFYFFSDDLDWCKGRFTMENTRFINTGKDYIDLELMSLCKHNIIANSSFSWWGAYLNHNPDKIVISPKNWVVKTDINKKIELQLPSWVKL